MLKLMTSLFFFFLKIRQLNWENIPQTWIGSPLVPNIHVIFLIYIIFKNDLNLFVPFKPTSSKPNRMIHLNGYDMERVRERFFFFLKPCICKYKKVYNLFMLIDNYLGLRRLVISIFPPKIWMALLLLNIHSTTQVLSTLGCACISNPLTMGFFFFNLWYSSQTKTKFLKDFGQNR
jgi:hypothetical protein